MKKMGTTIYKITHTRRDIIYYLALILSITIVYSRVAGNDFINYDDSLQLTENTHVLSGLTWNNFLWSFGDESPCSPLTWLTYTAGHSIFGLNPGPFHLLSLILHIVNSALIFFLLKKMTNEFWKSAFVGALFALHPINVESITWIAELNNVLSGLFVMLALLAYFFYTKQPDWKRYILALLVFELVLLAKPIHITLPFIFLLLDLWPLKRLQVERKVDPTSPWKINLLGIPVYNLLLEKIPFLILSILSLTSNLFRAEKQIGLYTSEVVSFSLRVSNAIVSTIKYIGKLFWPIDLAIFYPYPSMIPLWQVAGAFFILMLVTVITIRELRQYPYYFMGWLWFLFCLAPLLGIIQTGLWPELADRYAYISYIGIFIIISWCIPDLIPRWKYSNTIIATAGSGIILGLMILTWIQVGFWKNDETLMIHALNVTENNYVAHNNLGIDFFNKGNVDGAIMHLKEAVRINPLQPVTYFNLGNALLTHNDLRGATDEYQKGLAIDPTNINANIGLGIAMKRVGNNNEALVYFNKALYIDPHNIITHIEMGKFFQEMGKAEEATKHFNEALKIDPNNISARVGLQKILLGKDGVKDQAKYYEEALRIDPNNAKAHIGLATILKNQGRIDEAENHFNDALRTNPTNIDANKELGNLLFHKGNYDVAIKHYSAALRADPHQAEVYNNLGTVFIYKGDLNKAIEYYQKSIEEKPDYAEAVKNLNNALINQKNLELLSMRIQQSIKANPRNPVFYTRLGDIYRQLGKYNEAISQYQQAIMIQPNHVQAMYGVVLVYSKRQEYLKAIDVLQKILQMQPGNPEVYYNIACLYAKQGKTDESIAWLKQSIEKGFHNWDLIKKDPDLSNIRNTTFATNLIKNHANL
jgi:protein O-mannosyl-transferase